MISPLPEQARVSCAVQLLTVRSVSTSRLWAQRLRSDQDDNQEEHRPPQVKFDKMMEAADKISLKIRRFTGKAEEWPEWKLKFKAVLEVGDLLDNLMTTEEPSEFNAKALAAWKKTDRKVFFQLVLYTSEAAGNLVEQFEESCSGREAWEALIAKFEHKGAAGKVDLHRELMRSVMGEREDPDTFLVRIETIRRKLKVLKHVIPDDMLMGMILSKLPSNYETLVTIMEADEGLEYEDMKDQMRAFWKRRVRDSDAEEAEEDAAKALTAAMIGKKMDQRLCFGCGLAGHIKVNCPQNNLQRNGKNGWRANGKNGSRGNNRPFEGKCHKCHGQGHRAMDCPSAGWRTSDNEEKHEGKQHEEVHEAIAL